ncbi:MAG: phosphopentomutase [Lachnospiraceae bacterium]
MDRRIFLIVLDSFGIGYEPDAAEFGDVGANTIASVAASPKFQVPNMQRMGLFHIDGVTVGEKVADPKASYARLQEASKGKDTTIGHWEIAGLVSPKPLPTFPDGFPKETIAEFERQTGRKTLCNKPYSGTQVIAEYGEEHMRTGALIVYTSADSVFQIAAHEDVVPVEELYRYCEIARKILTGDTGVGRVIARPFVGEPGNFVRTSRRHDFSLTPPRDTMLEALLAAGYDTYGVGKIFDIFAGAGIAHTRRIVNNEDGMTQTLSIMEQDFSGLCFVNLVDFDMVYGHRRDIDGYANALSEFDKQLGIMLGRMREHDIVMITADHGCDPGYTGTDHTREYIPLLVYGKDIAGGVNIGTRKTFSDIAATILDVFGVENNTDGSSFKAKIMR